MKRLLLILCIAFNSTLAGYCPVNQRCITIEKHLPINPYLRLAKAVVMVESSGNPLAYNEKEGAVGLYQIRMIRLKDFNRQTGLSYKLSEMYDTIKSYQVFMFFALKYHPSELSTIAKKWNGTGKKTEIYWRKVKKHLGM